MKNEQRQLIKDLIRERNDQALFLEPIFDDALIGTAEVCGTGTVSAYDSTKCILILVRKFKISELEAYEKFQETISAYDDPTNRPVFVSDCRRAKAVSFGDIDEDMTIEDLITR